MVDNTQLLINQIKAFISDTDVDYHDPKTLLEQAASELQIYVVANESLKKTLQERDETIKKMQK